MPLRQHRIVAVIGVLVAVLNSTPSQGMDCAKDLVAKQQPTAAEFLSCLTKMEERINVVQSALTDVRKNGILSSFWPDAIVCTLDDKDGGWPSVFYLIHFDEDGAYYALPDGSVEANGKARHDIFFEDRTGNSKEANILTENCGAKSIQQIINDGRALTLFQSYRRVTTELE